MLESEITDHLRYESYCHSTNENSRNDKKVRNKYGESVIEVPQDRNGTF